MAFIRKKPSQSANVLPDSSRPERAKICRDFTPTELRSIAHRHGISTSPLDVHELAQHLNIKLLCVPMDDDISGSLKFSDSGSHWLMTINSLHHPNRQRFTIAHELAHFSLHTNMVKNFVDHNFFRNGETSPMEVQANKFASDLLMPEPEFRECAREFSGNIEALSRYFKVSTLAIRVRAKTLGMKGHGL